MNPKAKVSEPERIARLEHDPRGYPIPHVVLRADDGTPFFTINDDRKAWRAFLKGLCPICGERLGKWRWWVGGPQSAFDPNGWYLDLPGHHDCQQFALATCPYLAMPRYLGRDIITHREKLPPEARILLDETQTPGRPPLFVAVASDRLEFSERGGSLPYTRPLRPALAYEYWHEGKQIPAGHAMPILRGIFGPEWEVPPCQ